MNKPTEGLSMSSHSTTPRPVHAVAYYRKSTDDGGESVKQQRDWAHEVCPREGIEIVAEFTDEAVAGHDTARRGDFHRMLQFCQEQAKLKRPIEMVVCWHANRFSRADSQETDWYIWEYRRIGVARLFTSSRCYDFDKPDDRLVFGIEQETGNHKYSRDLAEASTRGRLDGAREGRWQGGPVPYGLRAETEKVTRKGRTYYRTKRLVLGPDGEVAVVRRIFREYADTFAGFRAIANRLNAEGVPPPRGKAWGTNTIKHILRNPVYLGRLVFARCRGGKFYGVVNAKPAPLPTATKRRNIPNREDSWVWSPAQTHEPIIDPALWDRARAKMAQRKGAHSDKKRTPRLGCYPLSGLVRCGACGGNMTARASRVVRGGGKSYTYRRVFCQTYNRTGGCALNAVDADDLLRAVLKKLNAGLTHPRFREELLAEVRRQDEQAESADPARLATLKTRLADLERKVQAAADKVIDEQDQSLLPALRERLRQRQKDRDAVAGEVEALTRAGRAPGNAEADAVVATVGRLAEATGEELREVLGEIVSYVELFFDHEPYGKGRTRSKFARGLIYLRPGLLADVLYQFTRVREGGPLCKEKTGPRSVWRVPLPLGASGAA
jgi:site-specific DNA recombinase